MRTLCKALLKTKHKLRNTTFSHSCWACSSACWTFLGGRPLLPLLGAVGLLLQPRPRQKRGPSLGSELRASRRWDVLFSCCWQRAGAAGLRAEDPLLGPFQQQQLRRRRRDSSWGLVHASWCGCDASSSCSSWSWAWCCRWRRRIEGPCRCPWRRRRLQQSEAL
jgi:hypothetical protein